MKKYILGIVTGLASIALVFTFVINASAGKPSLLATGNASAESGGIDFRVAFNVVDRDPVRGHFAYMNSLNMYFKGNVTCYYQEGNEAAFGGEIFGGNYQESYFLVEIQDNANSADRIRVRVFDEMPECALSGSFPGIVTNGDFEIFTPEVTEVEPAVLSSTETKEVSSDPELVKPQPTPDPEPSPEPKPSPTLKKPFNYARGNVTWTARTHLPEDQWITGILSAFDAVDKGEGMDVDKGRYKTVVPEREGFEGGSLTLDLSCVNVTDGQAWFAGEVISATGEYTGTEGDTYLYWVHDVDSPGDVGPDEIGGRSYDDIATACSVVDNEGWTGTGKVTGGDLTVHFE